MRADDIRAAVLEVNELALAQCDKLEANEAVSDHEVADYRAAIDRVADFWRNASPAFCHAWFELTIKEGQ